MANSTQMITDLNSVISNGPQGNTGANAIAATGQTLTGGISGGSGNYASGTYYGGIMDYVGMTKLALLKCQELAVLLERVLANTDPSGDSTNELLLVKILNNLQ